MITDGDLAYGLNRIKSKQAICMQASNYYDGSQDLSFATDAFRAAFGYLFKEFSYNRCQAVVDAFDARLAITGWETDGKLGFDPADKATESPIEAAANDVWRRNNMDERQSEIHGEALLTGSSYLIIWPHEETGLATYYPNKSHLITTVCHDDGGDAIAYAVKTWREERGEYAGRWRVTVYEPDIIRRYITKSKRSDIPEKMTHLVPFEDDDQPESDNPYGIVPVFHFRNGNRAGNDVAGELRDVIPLQDALNKQIADFMVAAEYLGWPQRVIAGIEPQQNPLTGKLESPFETGKDRMVVIADAMAKWGEFATAQLEQFTSAQDNFDMKISRVSQVPVHWLNQTGDFPSGEALKTSESPFVAKATKKATRFGGKHAEAMQFALTIDAVPGDLSGIQPIWAPVESRSEQESLNAALMKKSLSVPLPQLWAELGYSPDEIKRFEVAEAKRKEEEMASFATSFDRGQVDVGDR